MRGDCQSPSCSPHGQKQDGQCADAPSADLAALLVHAEDARDANAAKVRFGDLVLACAREGVALSPGEVLLLANQAGVAVG